MVRAPHNNLIFNFKTSAHVVLIDLASRRRLTMSTSAHRHEIEPVGVEGSPKTECMDRNALMPNNLVHEVPSGCSKSN